MKRWLTWVWCIDTFFYSLAFPIVHCVVNRQLDMMQYAVPSLIFSACGGLLNLKITEKATMRRMYDRWFLQITLLDMGVWLAYFSLWMAGFVPDRWYPVACAIMHVSTVELSRAVRMEFENRLFPKSEDRTEFGNACGIATRLYNSVACVILMLACLKSMKLGQAILMFAMIVDNLVFMWLWRRFESGKLVI